MKRGRKKFFFEKKNQKTFTWAAPRERTNGRWHTPNGKSFLVLFFKKELLSLIIPRNEPIWPAPASHSARAGTLFCTNVRK
jgi:hypothetical protein